MNLKIRKAEIFDCKQIWEWRNDPDDSKFSFNQKFITLESHIEWFDFNIKNEKIIFYIIESNDIPVGQVRLEMLEFSQAEVHITIGKQFRSKGIALRALYLVEEQIKDLKIDLLLAHIKPDNINSVILFLKSGFIFSNYYEFKGNMCYKLIKDIL